MGFGGDTVVSFVVIIGFELQKNVSGGAEGTGGARRALVVKQGCSVFGFHELFGLGLLLP